MSRCALVWSGLVWSDTSAITRLRIKDLEFLGKRWNEIEKDYKRAGNKVPKDLQRKHDVLVKCRELLEAGKDVRSGTWSVNLSSPLLSSPLLSPPLLSSLSLSLSLTHIFSFLFSGRRARSPL